jgi:hypothetical protein
MMSQPENPLIRHCERSAAIQRIVERGVSGLPRFARNDKAGVYSRLFSGETTILIHTGITVHHTA